MPSINDTLSISENSTTEIINSGVQVYIDGTRITRSIERNSLNVENILTRQVDRCKFVLRKYGTKHIFIPKNGNEVKVYNDGTQIFGGIIVKLVQRVEDYKILLYDIECEDYTRLLDKKLVADTFSNKTITQILESINANYLEDFTLNHAQGINKQIAYIAFNYCSVSNALTQLADLVNYDWYVDYDRDIHFFSKSAKSASIDINDDDGSYLKGSLRIRRDNSQLRNKIYIRGGEYLADTLTSETISDGIQNVYPLPYRYEDLQVSVTGEVWDGGVDGVDAITPFDYLWNKSEKFIRFRGDRIPNDTSSIRMSGQPYLPVRVVTQDLGSIAETSSVEGGDGVYEFLVVDNSINSKEGARQRATEELNSYKETLSEAQFATYKDGLQAGQRIRINSPVHGVDEYFIINKVTARMYTSEALRYEVSLVTTKTLGIIEFLQGLLLKETKQIVINENEIIDLVYAKSESLTIAEEFETSISHNPVSEEIAVGEIIIEQELNYPIEFVLGPYEQEDPNLKGRWKLDGNLLDSSKNGNNGNAITDTLQTDLSDLDVYYKFNETDISSGIVADSSGNSLDAIVDDTYVTANGEEFTFDDTDIQNKVMLADSDTLFESGDLSFSFSISPTNILNNQYIWCHYNWRFKFSGLKIQFSIGRCDDPSTGPFYYVTSLDDLSNDTYYHIIGIYHPDPVGGNGYIKLYVNDVLQQTLDIGSSEIALAYGGRNLQWGNSGHGSVLPYEGKIKNSRIFSRILDNGDINELSVYKPLDENAEGIISKGVEFTGCDLPKRTTGDYISLDNVIEVESNNHSISFWYKSSESYFQMLFQRDNGSNSGNIEFRPSDNTILCESRSNNYWNNKFATGIDIDDGEWHHYCFVFSSSNSKLYVDGDLTDTQSENTDASDFKYFVFGGYGKITYTYGECPTGVMDEVRVYSRILTSTEIEDLYDNPTTSFGQKDAKKVFILGGSYLGPMDA